MENKINLVEILKDCPMGMELNCTMFDNVTLLHVSNMEDAIYPITVLRGDGNSMILTKYGQCANTTSAKCVIFPKGKNTWEGFVPPFKFKDGDILYIDTNDEGGDDDCFKYTFILKVMDGRKVIAHCYMTAKDYFKPREVYLTDNTYPIRFATEDEKKKLFDAIRKNGYKWDSESKTLKKIEPRFKVGDRIKCAYNNNQYDIKELTNTHYILVEVKTKFKYNEPIINDKDWELVPNKFDINTLKPFESKVLVRHTKDSKWTGIFFSFLDRDLHSYCYKFVTTALKSYPMMIPYKGNEHLLGKTDECDEFYRVWEE